MRTRRIWLGAAALVAMTACSGAKGHPSAAAPSTTATTSATGAAGSLPTGTTTASTTAKTTAGSTIAGSTGCRSSQLSAAVTNAQGAAGTIYSHLTFTNKSATACIMTGYPGVSFVDGSGHQIGAPLSKSPGYGGTVNLAAGGTAAALFLYHDAYVGTSPLCMTPAAAAGLRVYPPGETAALFVPDPTMACANPAATGVGEISAVTIASKLPG